MFRDKNIVIENYIIEDKLFSHPNGSSFYNAKHKILKKTFTLNKIPLQPSPGTPNTKGQPSSDPSALLDKVNFQMSLLRHLNGQGTPRCHKVIKTPHHLYIVYDEFPTLSLREYLSKSILTKAEKLEIMIKMAQLVRSIHKMGVIVNAVTLQNLRIYQNGGIIISDMSAGCRKSEPEVFKKETIQCFSQYQFPNQLKMEENCGPFTDVFMLGKVFSFMMKQELSNPNLKYKNIQKIIKEMVNQSYEDRINVDELIMELQTEKNNSGKGRKESDNECFSALLTPPALFNELKPRKFSMDESNKDRNVIISPKVPFNSSKKQNNKPDNQPKSLLQKVKSYSSTTNSTKPVTLLRDTKFKLTNATTQRVNSIRSKSLRSWSNCQKNVETVKKINKKRNLAFFILDLSEFVIQQWTCPELGYLFVKYANLTLNDCLEELDRIPDLRPEEKELREIVIGQKAKIAATQTQMGEIFSKEYLDPLFRRELELNNIISDRYLESKITSFSLQTYKQLEKPSTPPRSMHDATNILFKVCMILKKMEMGSYEKYWQGVYQSNFASLSSQRCIQEQKQLGHRYLKSKIKTILKIE